VPQPQQERQAGGTEGQGTEQHHHDGHPDLPALNLGWAA
jgi:hypothetical protein